jgi:hypothetical protein
MTAWLHREGTETWRVLRAYFPGSIETHNLVQDFFFGEDLRLRRHDYSVNIAGGFKAAQLTSDYVVANGISLPTKRRAYTRGPDRRPIMEMLMVAIDFSHHYLDVAYKIALQGEPMPDQEQPRRLESRSASHGRDSDRGSILERPRMRFAKSPGSRTNNGSQQFYFNRVRARLQNLWRSVLTVASVRMNIPESV